MNIDVKKILATIKSALRKARPYSVITVFVFVFAVYGFMVVRIGQFSAREPSDTSVNEKLSTVKQPKIDDATKTKLLELRSQNVEVEALFEKYRNNPFSE